MVVLLGASLGLDRGHAFSSLPTDTYVASPLELFAIFVAGAPIGWYARRVWGIGPTWWETWRPARELDRMWRERLSPDVQD